MRGKKLGANLPLFWNNDGKDRPKGQICPLAKKGLTICTTIEIVQSGFLDGVLGFPVQNSTNSQIPGV